MKTVEEGEWLACEAPARMLKFLHGRASEWKLRLFAVACCRRITHLLDERCRKALDVAERFAEGNGGPQELEAARRAAYDAFYEFDDSEGRESAADAVESACWLVDVGGQAAYAAWTAAALASVGVPRHLRKAAQRLARRAQSTLLRDVVGNPFRPLPPRDFPPHVVGLAGSCYAAFPAVSGDYLVLADALDDLGEERAAAHCREPMHVKGCHILPRALR